jgi:hypothetical protein
MTVVFSLPSRTCSKKKKKFLIDILHITLASPRDLLAHNGIQFNLFHILGCASMAKRDIYTSHWAPKKNDIHETN